MDVEYKQCRLKGDSPCDSVCKTVWIPSIHAKVGKPLIIDDPISGSERWVVEEVYSKELPYEYINERSQDYKKTREASDI